MMNKPSQSTTIPLQSLSSFIPQEEVGRIKLTTYIRVILDNLWLIASIVFVVSLLGITYALLHKPVYESNMLIQVEEEGNPEQSKNILGDLKSIFYVKTSAISEMELLRSRLVVSSAVDNLQLELNIHPKYFPIIGTQLARLSTRLSNPGILGYGGYVWGAEKIYVSIFNIPNLLLNHQFIITAEENGKFRLSENEKNIQLKGEVGSTLYFETNQGVIELKIDQLSAKAGAQFLLKRASRLATIENVQKAMTIAELGKQSGVISVKIKGNDPNLVRSILGEISKSYINNNKKRKTEEADRSLSFLNKQLPEIKQKLDQSEEKYNKFRNIHGTIDLSEEAKLSLQQSSAVKIKRLELQQKRTELLTRFTNEHPFVEGINNQINEMSGAINTIANHIGQLPMLEQEILNMSREIKVNTDLYTTLLNTIQQLRLITAGKVSNVRLIDVPTTPEKPLKSRSEIVIFSVILGLILGVLGTILKKYLDGGIDDPTHIEKIFGVPLHAIIPHSKRMKELYKQVRSDSQKVPLLAYVSAADIAIESLRTFRNTLQFLMSDAKNNIVLMTGATPEIGKTFVSVNLAAITAITEKKVLLIDADLRNGHLHQYFGLTNQNGLSNFLSGKIERERIIHREVMEHMDFISTGSLPFNPSELLLRPRFGELLKLLSSEYDLILIDTTPILLLSDTIVIASHAGTIYIVARAGVTTEDEIKESMKRLSQAGLSAKGILFNDVKVWPGRYGYEYPPEKHRRTQYLLEKNSAVDVN